MGHTITLRRPCEILHIHSIERRSMTAVLQFIFGLLWLVYVVTHGGSTPTGRQVAGPSAAPTIIIVSGCCPLSIGRKPCRLSDGENDAATAAAHSPELYPLATDGAGERKPNSTSTGVAFL